MGPTSTPFSLCWSFSPKYYYMKIKFCVLLKPVCDWSTINRRFWLATCSIRVQTATQSFWFLGFTNCAYCAKHVSNCNLHVHWDIVEPSELQSLSDTRNMAKRKRESTGEKCVKRGKYMGEDITKMMMKKSRKKVDFAQTWFNQLKVR